jgi:raffinose/stachyose/melibiose transport system substrate-binding protein
MRRMPYLSVVLALALLVASCGGGAANATPTSAPPATAAPATPAPETSAPATSAPAETAAATSAPSGEQVTLTMGSWRVDDVEQMNRILAEFTKAHPNITIKFDPTNPPDYNATLRAQLEGGTAPDLFYLRSYATSRQLFEQGYLEPLDALPGLTDNFSDQNRAPWSTDDGKPYGVPFIAVSHGIYYNVDQFQALNLSVPATWEDLLATAQKIKDAGFTPFANASGDEWTIAEIVFMNLAPNFIGGLEGRQAYLTGKRCFNDEHVVAAFQAVKDIAPFLPEGQEALKYYDSQQLFLQGKALMWMGGSWDIPVFEKEAPGFQWSVFPVPPPSGQPGYVTFHLDAGMGLNSKSAHKEEAKQFLEWMETPEFATQFGNELPGFFPLSKSAPTLTDEHAKTFLDFNTDHGTDVRFAWEKLLDGSPDGYSLMQDGAIAVIKGEKTPQQAADDLQNGLAQWFEPAKNCQK